VASVARQERRDVDACIRLVDDLDININVWPEHPRSAQSAAMPYTAASEFEGVMARHHGSRIRRLVVRRLNQDELKASPRRDIGLQHTVSD